MAAINSVNMPLSLQQVQQDAFLQQPKDVNGTTSDAKIQKGSKQFEALLLGSWLQQAEHSFASVPGSDGDDDSQRDQVMSFGVQSLATFMAGSGKFGIAEMVAKAMEQKPIKLQGKRLQLPACRPPWRPASRAERKWENSGPKLNSQQTCADREK